MFYSAKILKEKPEEMSKGGEVEVPRMMNGGVGVSEFRLPANLQDLLVGIGNPQSIPAAASVPATTTTATTEVPFVNSREDFYIRPEDYVFRGDFPTTEGAYEQYIQQLMDELNAGLASLPDQIAAGSTTPTITEETVTQTIAEMLAEGTLTPDEIQRRIDEGDITKDDVLSIISGGFELNENQLAQLFEQGILTREEIEALVAEAIQDIEAETEEAVEEALAEQTAGLTEEQVNQLISQGLEGFDTSQFATQEQLQGLENLFQNYLTPEQLESYLGQQQFVTPEQLAEATKNDYESTIKELTDKLGQLETKYQDVQSQYEADAVNQQIQETKEDLDTFFKGAVPTGPRTGSTSQFSAGASFLPGSSPMANLIGGQRQGFGQDPFSTYLKTFTPSYGSYQAPFTAEEYGQGFSPLLGTQYSNPFTGGSFSQGGQVSNGIMDLTNFDTNVAPFQNAFRPNVPRN